MVVNRIIGITGNICTGKSAMANILIKTGAKVQSHDVFLYSAYANSKCQEEIVSHFGDAVLVDGSVDRTSLKMYLKEHPEECKRLWDITDKYVDPLVEKFLQENDGLSFFECAPLYEKAWNFFCEQVITCYVPDQIRILRLMERAKKRDDFSLSEEEAIAIIRQQAMSQEEKMKRADFVINNSANFESLERQTVHLYNYLRREGE